MIFRDLGYLIKLGSVHGKGGGGGSSGAVSWPAYLQQFHSDMLNSGDGTTGIDSLESSLVDAMNDALGASPFAAAVPESPDGELTAMAAAITSLDAAIVAISPSKDLTTAMGKTGAGLLSTAAMSRGDALSAILANFSALREDSSVSITDRYSDFESDVYTAIKGRIDALMTAGKTAAREDYPAIVGDMVTAVNTAFNTAIAAVNTQVNTYVNPTTYLDARITAFGAILSARTDAHAYPAFEAGMRNINAVQSSAFTLGRANIEEMRLAELAQFSADIYAKATTERSQILRDMTNNILDKITTSSAVEYDGLMKYVDHVARQIAAQLSDVFNTYKVDLATAAGLYQGDADTLIKGTMDMGKVSVSNLMNRTELLRALAVLKVEKERLAIVALTEEEKERLEIAESDARWDLSIFQYAANAMAGIGGGTASQAQGKKNPVANALAGGLSGAVAGAMIGGSLGIEGAVAGGMTAGPVGAIVGAVLGIGMSFM